MSRESVSDSAVRALSDELDATSIYGRLAKRFNNDPVGAKFAEIARMESEHVLFWTDFFRRRGLKEPPAGMGGKRLALYGLALKMLGLGLTIRIMEMNESDAVEFYSEMIEDPRMDEDEEKRLRNILEDELIHEQEFTREESRFGGFLAYIKDAVLGMNDGLVEILSATTGLAGFYGNPSQVFLGGLVVSIAGALSMGTSTFASVKVQRQVQEGILKRIMEASLYVAHVFQERVAAHMLRKGYSEQVSTAVALESSKDQRLLSGFIAAEEYGLKIESLEDPLRAGLYAGLFNCLGAFLPLLPYLFSPSMLTAVLISVAFAGAALAFTGSLIAVLANLHVKKKIAEMIFSGLGSAAATYLLGRIASFLLGAPSI